MKSQEIRYVILKIKNEKDNTEINILNIYFEHDKENSYEELIPEGVRSADCIRGELNKEETGMIIHSIIYHRYNLWEKIETNKAIKENNINMKESKKCPNILIYIIIKNGGRNFDDPILSLFGYRKMSHCHN